MGRGLQSAPCFSIAVLARNEARQLPQLLHTLNDFIECGGEVLLLDTGSTDDTVVIGRRQGCRVEAVNGRFDSILDVDQVAAIERRFAVSGDGPLVAPGQRLFHFGDARQHAGLLAANGFVLQLDASDRLTAMETNALDRWIDSGVGAFEYEQQYGGVGLRISRFYDRDRFHWEGRVHETLQATGASPPASRTRCDAMQLRVRHDMDPDKTRNYLAGLALQVLESPQKPRWWHYLGRELFYNAWYRSAIVVLEAHAAMENAWLAERSQGLCFVGQCLESLGSASDAQEAYRRAFALDPTRREPLLRLATICSRRGEFDVAAQCATEALAIPRTSAYPELDANYTWIPHSLLYWSLFWLGRRHEARVHWEMYRSLAPDDKVMREHARLFPPASPARDALPRTAGC